ncbi:hypothetical protein L3V83_12385 [Thiotrichales bacterium 19X7-9]|nr:hypothetical protein [Thiotrichales bacterium 19X7-9]
MRNQVLDKELKLKKNFLKKLKPSNPAIILLILIILLLAIILVQQFSDSQKTSQLNSHVTTLIKSVENTNQTQKQLTQALNKQSQVIQNNHVILNKTINNSEKAQERFEKSINQQLKNSSETINNNYKSLDQLMRLLFNKSIGKSKNNNTITYSILDIPKGYKRTDQYTISGIAPYGVIIQDKQGNFLIARLNKQLSVGVITAITQHYVIAGDYVITDESSNMHNSVSIIKKMTP